ncbi:MAG: acetyl-CoA carboxylase biotin carboxyl carrier protein [Desulfobacteraceae bacterium]|nr:acetyl-CoA carboxylase biotin carboxyl carrier protein [Desulfobacteraceae bacterium]
MGSIDHDDLVEILKMVGESKIDELHLEMGDLKLIAKKSGTGRVVQETETIPKKAITATVPEEAPEIALEQEPEPEMKIPISTPQKEEVKPVADAEELGYTPIKAPLLGTFYRAPKPGAPPFVEEDQFVTEDDTVCIIEVMKLFNTTKAGVRGHIRKICAEDGELVEFNQTLFLVEEAADEEMLEEGRV